MIDRKGTPGFRTQDIPPGTCKIGWIGDKEVAIFNVGGEFYATQPHCTHAGGPLCEGALWGNIVTCPWHGSEFDVRTGEVTLDPADRPLMTYPVRVENGMLVVEMREEAITETVPKEGFN